jgi:hypothetical protein
MNMITKQHSYRRYKFLLNKKKRKIFNFTKHSFSVILHKVKAPKQATKFNLDDDDMP